MINYAWVVVLDWTSGEEKIVSVVGSDRANTCLATAEEISKHPEAKEFRMLDDDDNVYYQGYYVGYADENMFAPLDDYGEPNAGCTSIEYWNKETLAWEQL